MKSLTCRWVGGGVVRHLWDSCPAVLPVMPVMSEQAQQAQQAEQPS